MMMEGNAITPCLLIYTLSAPTNWLYTFLVNSRNTQLIEKHNLQKIALLRFLWERADYVLLDISTEAK